MKNDSSNRPIRTTTVDLIRTAALIGICVVNLPFLGLPADQVLQHPTAPLDQAANLAVQTLFEGKFFLLFSFLFGWGFAIQAQTAARRGQSPGARYARRLFGLVLFGCLHAIFVFTGDILLLYAILGALLWCVSDWPVQRLLRAACAMIPLAVLGLGVLGLVATTGMPLAGSHSLGGGFIEATRARLADWLTTFAFLLLFQGPLAFAAFLVGLVAAWTDFFDLGSQGRVRLARAFPWLLVVGLILNLAVALAPVDDSLAALVLLLAFAPAAPMLSLAWLHLLLVAGDRVRVPDWLLLAGRNSLTAYILQGVLAGFLFGGYGLGLYGDLEWAQLLGLALVTALSAMGLTAALAARTGRAPFETLLRWMTEGQLRSDK